DRYYFETAGSAQGDIIKDSASGSDTIYFSNISSAPTFRVNGYDLIVVTDHGDLTVKNQFLQNLDQIEFIQWRTGGSGSYTQISLASSTYAFTFMGTNNADTITVPINNISQTASHAVYGLGGDDIISGSNYTTSSDSLYGGDGNDIIYGLRGADTLY